MANQIPKEFIDQLMTRVDIVEVVDRYVPLTRKGKEYQACCPFHDEKTPSFTVSSVKQFYHCFGCNAHGTAIGFLMEYANLGFVEAVEELASAVGLPVPREAGQPGVSTDISTDLFEIVAQSHRWFQQQLRTHATAKQAIAYLKERGLDGKTVIDFGIGYAPDGWDNLRRALGTDPHKKQQLLKAGMLIRSESREDEYDRFRGRVMFPIEDHRGKVVAFGGRVLGAGEPKYLNSPETPLFHKGAELYGLQRARRAIGAAESSIVVEGYMDVIGLAQFDIGNAVATLGTATTRTHVQKLFRLASEIVFCFDGDRAGRTAAWKAMQTALPEMQDGRQIGFLFLPEGEDPDSIVRTEKKEGFQKRVAEAQSLPDFLFKSLLANIDMERMDGRARLVSLAMPFIAKLPNGALREIMRDRLSSLSGLSEQQLESHQKSTPSRLTRRAGQKTSSKRALGQGQLPLLDAAISVLLQDPSLASSITDPEKLDILTGEGVAILRSLITESCAQPKINTARLLETFRDEPNYAYLSELAARRHFIDQGVLVQHFNDTLDRLLDGENKKQLKRIEQKFQEGVDPKELKSEMERLYAQKKKPAHKIPDKEKVFPR